MARDDIGRDTFTPTASGLFIPETVDAKHRAKVKAHIVDSLSLLGEIIAESQTVQQNQELQVSIFNSIAANLAGD